MTYQIIDNFLEKEDFLKIKNTMMSENFEWYYSEDVSNKKSNDGFYFVHNFYKEYVVKSNKIILLNPIIF